MWWLFRKRKVKPMPNRRISVWENKNVLKVVYLY